MFGHLPRARRWSSGTRSAAERIQAAGVFAKLMTQNIEVPVIRADPEALVTRPVPAIDHFYDFVNRCGRPIFLSLALQTPRRDEAETQRAFISLIARVAFDLEGRAHGVGARQLQQRRSSAALKTSLQRSGPSRRSFENPTYLTIQCGRRCRSLNTSQTWRRRCPLFPGRCRDRR